MSLSFSLNYTLHAYLENIGRTPCNSTPPFLLLHPVIMVRECGHVRHGGRPNGHGNPTRVVDYDEKSTPYDLDIPLSICQKVTSLEADE